MIVDRGLELPNQSKPPCRIAENLDFTSIDRAVVDHENGRVSVTFDLYNGSRSCSWWPFDALHPDFYAIRALSFLDPESEMFLLVIALSDGTAATSSWRYQDLADG